MVLDEEKFSIFEGLYNWPNTLELLLFIELPMGNGIRFVYFHLDTWAHYFVHLIEPLNIEIKGNKTEHKNVFDKIQFEESWELLFIDWLY